MAHKRKGQLTVSGEWAKHLRKFFRRKFWKGERKAGQKLIREERMYQIDRESGTTRFFHVMTKPVDTGYLQAFIELIGYK